MCIKTFKSRAAFSLVEVMIAMAIASVVLGISAYFIVESTRATLKGTSITQNNMDQWSLSSRLMIDSRMANGLVIYDSLVDTAIKLENRVTTPNAQGNLLIFTKSSFELPDGTKSSVPLYKNLIGYLYKTDKKVLYKFEFTIPDSEATNPIEQIILAHKGEFILVPQADDIEPVSAAAKLFYFLAPSYARIAFTAHEGEGKTKDSKLIESSFIVRK